MASNNLENLIIEFNRHINIDGDRQKYDKLFTGLRDKINKRLQNNGIFRRLFNGFRLEGSYADNLKVSKPDEFDLVFILEFPRYEKLIVSEVSSNPGFVTINVKEVLNCIENDKSQKCIYDKLKNEWSTKRETLAVYRLQNWLRDLFLSVLKEIENELIVDNVEYELKYDPQGPAHTIKVYLRGGELFAVDFVPAIKLKLENDPYEIYTYEGIPKPEKNQTAEYDNFRQSFFCQEAAQIKDKMNLKNALRYMKKFRDSHQNMSNLKSYYIKTLFLWKNKKESADYWNNPLNGILIDMFSLLEEALGKGELLFYWNAKCNMFAIYKASQLEEMLKCVAKARLTLDTEKPELKNPTKIQKIFLIRNERCLPLLPSQEEKEKEKKGEEEAHRMEADNDSCWQPDYERVHEAESNQNTLWWGIAAGLAVGIGTYVWSKTRPRR